MREMPSGNECVHGAAQRGMTRRGGAAWHGRTRTPPHRRAARPHVYPHILFPKRAQVDREMWQEEYALSYVAAIGKNIIGSGGIKAEPGPSGDKVVQVPDLASPRLTLPHLVGISTTLPPGGETGGESPPTADLSLGESLPNSVPSPHAV